MPPELTAPGLDDLGAAEGVVREAVPAQAQAAPQVPAVYLPSFYQAERSVALTGLGGVQQHPGPGGAASGVQGIQVGGPPVRDCAVETVTSVDGHTRLDVRVAFTPVPGHVYGGRVRRRPAQH